MIEDIKCYKEHFYKDYGFYIALLISIIYLIIFRPWRGGLDIISQRVTIFTFSLAIISITAVFCYQSRNDSKEVVKDESSDFYKSLMREGILDEIIFLYRWNVKIGMLTILFIALYNLLIFSTLLNNKFLGTFAAVPIFSLVWLISEYRYSNQLANKLDQYILEYRKIKDK